MQRSPGVLPRKGSRQSAPVLIAARLKPFGLAKMLYYKRTPLSIAEEERFGFRYSYFDDMLDHCDIIVIVAPQTPETKGIFNRDSLWRMKRGAWIVNIARGGIVEQDALVEALEEGRIAGYAGDVWDPEPPPPDHPWRTMPNHMMTPHTAGTTLDGQQTYADGVRRCLEALFDGEPIEYPHDRPGRRDRERHLQRRPGSVRSTQGQYAPRREQG